MGKPPIIKGMGDTRVVADAHLLSRNLGQFPDPEAKPTLIANWAVYQKLQPALREIRRNHYAVDTSRDITPVIDKIAGEVNK